MIGIARLYPPGLGAVNESLAETKTAPRMRGAVFSPMTVDVGQRWAAYMALIAPHVVVATEIGASSTVTVPRIPERQWIIQK